MDLSLLRPVDLAFALALVWIGLGVIGLAFMRSSRLILRAVFPIGAVVALTLALVGVWAINVPSSAAILPAGLPGLPFHVRVDPLSGFFLLLLGGVSFGISLFSSGYFRGTEAKALGLLKA